MSTFVHTRRRQDRIAMWMPVVLLLLLAAITSWLDFTISRSVVERHKATANAPEQFLESFTALRYEKGGAMTQQLKAERATYFPQYNRTVVSKPIFSTRPDGSAPLDVIAGKAVVLGRNDKIDFAGKVRATQSAFNGQPARVMETETLQAVPATGELATQSAVRITQADVVVETKGMRANTKSQQVSGQGPARIVLQPK